MDYKDIFPLILTKPILGRLNILFFEDKLLNIPNVFHWLHILVLFQTPIISFPTTSVLGLITWCIGYSLMSKPSRANCLLWSDMAMAVSEKKKSQSSWSQPYNHSLAATPHVHGPCLGYWLGSCHSGRKTSCSISAKKIY